MKSLCRDREEKVSVPTYDFSVFTCKDDEGKLVVILSNTGLRNFQKKEVFGWYCSMFIQFEKLAENGMPTSEESQMVYDWVDEVSTGLQCFTEEPNAIFVARVTNQGMAHVIWQVKDPEMAHNYLKDIADKENYPRKFEIYMEEDEKWDHVSYFLNPELKE